MKLRNKKTGEIFDKGIPPKPVSIVIGNGVKYYDTIDAFNEEWEDYEEPKGIYRRIVWEGNKITLEYDDNGSASDDYERLKAWKRLKDKGFKFVKWKYENMRLCIWFEFDKEAWATETKPDLDLLFGGEETCSE